ncbi:hypothetical protein DFJ73DRAFT_832181 [Zopfochytrium polystomum]|nr:hypothetical protein DFJ73DRAFT_832181 [Zopfochytrium polystomum]
MISSCLRGSPEDAVAPAVALGGGPSRTSRRQQLLSCFGTADHEDLMPTPTIPVHAQSQILSFSSSQRSSKAPDTLNVSSVVEEIQKDSQWRLDQLRSLKEYLTGAAHHKKGQEESQPDNEEDAEINALKKWPLSDGDYAYDVFISHRVVPEQELAMQLYFRLNEALLTNLILERQGAASATKLENGPRLERVFWDHDSLIVGEDWRKGFVNGLKKSRLVVLLISEASTPRMKTSHIETDNLLLEWETALMAAKHHRCAIFPVFIKGAEKLIKPETLPCARPKTVYGTQSCSLSARSILNKVLSFDPKDCVHYDGTNIDEIISQCLLKVKSFSSPNESAIRLRREDQFAELIPTDVDDMPNWNKEELRRHLSPTQFLVVAESLPFNEFWKRLILSFDISQCKEYVKSFGQSLRKNKTLIQLDLSGNVIGDNGLSSLIEGLIGDPPASLQVLKLSSNSITIDGLKGIFERLLPKVPIKRLGLKNNLIGKTAKESDLVMRNSLPSTSLEYLDISLNKDAYLSLDYTNLTGLRAGNNDYPFGRNYLSALKGNASLKSLEVASCGIDGNYECLVGNTCLTRLDLSNNEMLALPEHFSSLMTGISGATALEILKINDVDLANVIHLAEHGVSQHPTLRDLYLSNCQLSAAALSDLMSAIADSEVQLLDVSKNTFGDEGIEPIRNAAGNAKSTLWDIYVGLCNITGEGAIRLISAMKTSGKDFQITVYRADAWPDEVSKVAGVVILEDDEYL